MPGDVEQWINGRGRDERLTIVGRNEEKSQTRQQAPEVAYDHEVWDRSLRNRYQGALYVVQSVDDALQWNVIDRRYARKYKYHVQHPKYYISGREGNVNTFYFGTYELYFRTNAHQGLRPDMSYESR